MHTERRVSSLGIAWKWGEKIKVRNGQGKVLEILTVLDKDKHGKDKQMITFQVQKLRDF